MNKAVKIILWIIGILAGIALILFLVVGPMMKKNTKKHSPEVTEIYNINDVKIEVFYSSPTKKGREIFGSLVPYDQVWRTGANEATTFSTSKDLLIDGKTLPAGKYTLWTIPSEKSWQIIFNSEMYGWGVSWQDSKPMREEEHDVLIATAIVSNSITSEENFNINILEGPENNPIMLFSWDQVVVPLKMEKK
ncbi:MAG: DUF2911 domain-containing protein [Flavobacteriaceae bacterium]|nr:DUF2911 domain-containing protein [Flavobacteriaceae bacterium]